MHYSSTLTGTRTVSLVDDPTFFLSDQGKTSPHAELEATLSHLFSPSADNNEATACRFPARLAWLTKALTIEKGTLPNYSCSHLNNWLYNLGADRITLIFPVSVLNSPASMFGHTFLRLDRTAAKKPDLLAWTVNYAARTDEMRGLSFALNGLFGGYPGKFSLAPYHKRVKAYSDIENRDMWEYELSYSSAEVHFMLLHLWELLPVYFDYYFIDENCSYQLLALLEAARPSLRLTENFHLDATPAETVRVVTTTPGLLTKATYRPSLREIIVTRANTLTPADQELAKALALGDAQPNDTVFAGRTDTSRAEVLELAAEYNAYLEAISKKQQDVFDDIPSDDTNSAPHIASENRQLRLLAARSEIDVDSQQPVIATPRYRPDQGHRGHRIGLRYGNDDSDQYLQFDFRWAYHDLYDPSSGFLKGAQLEFFQPAFRHYTGDNVFKLESLNFANIISAPARSYFIKPFSWEASAALKRYRFDDDDRPLTGDVKAGAGVSYQLSDHAAASIFANTQLTVSNEFDHDIALALGGRAELIYTISDDLHAGLHTRVMQYFEGITQTSYEYGGTLRFSLRTNSALLVKFSENREFGGSFFTSQLSWQLYF